MCENGNNKEDAEEVEKREKRKLRTEMRGEMNIQEPTPNKPYILLFMRGDDLIFCKVKCKLPIYSVLVIMKWASSFKNAPLGGKKHFLLISTFNYLS